MKTRLISSAIATLVSAASLFGADAPAQPGHIAGTPVDLTKTPKGLCASDWSGIRGAYERGRHAIVANPDGTHQARNPGQAWLTRFDGRGFTVTPDAGGWSWGLELAGYGEVTDVRQDGDKISYVRGEGLTEWFVNDGRGLEQGWTLAKRPEHVDAGPIRLHLALRGNLCPQVSNNGSSVAFLNESGGAALTYGELKAWDADGKTVQACFEEGEIEVTSLSVVLDDTGARYPITIDPIAQQAYLKASNTEVGDEFGASVAVFGDTIVVGAFREGSSATGVNGNQTDNSAPGAGAVYVFVRNGTTWSQQAYLKASNTEAGDHFGISVAVSGDTVVVGAYESSSTTGVDGNQNDNSAVHSGAAYVFVRSGTTWSQQAYLKASNTEAGDDFGVSVAVSGSTVVVGAHFEASNAIGVNGDQSDNTAAYSGAAYVFVRNENTWSQQAYLKASNTDAGDNFGFSVAVSGDTALVGANNENAAYVFVRGGTTWIQQAYLNAGASEFGISVAISGDTLVVGAFMSEAAYVFVRNGTTWSQQACLKASITGTGTYFGISVAVSGDTVVVGAFLESSSATGMNGNQSDNSAENSGAAYVFVRSGNTWSQYAYLKASNTGTSDHFGGSVAVSGPTVVVGASYEASNATGVNGQQTDNSAFCSGAAYVFSGLSYSLSASSVHGSTSGAGDYEVGSTATLAVTVDSGYLFTAWTGDATGTANPLSVLMDSDKTIGATFTPDTNDDDNDGWTNYQEIVVYGTNPALWDTDGDGVKDSKDAFPLDPAETLDTDHDGIGDNADPDDDGDGLTDVDEINIYHTNPKRADSDGDGINDYDELMVYHTDPMDADMDHDGLSDGAEVFTHHTNPKIGDTDGDGFLDGYEILTGHLPLDPRDKPALMAEARTAIEFTFPAELGKTYRIEASPDLSTWETVEDGIAGNGGQIQRFYTTRNMPKRYFRVEESAP